MQSPLWVTPPGLLEESSTGRERNFSKPDIAIAYQSVANPVLFQLISLEIYELSKHIKYIGEVNEIAKTMVRFSFLRRITDYKNNRGNFKCS